ncbi:unnamed protein product [Cylindrotheca closterium]|uniref:Uncharacterized protein n=1 Tax=Cylindrotheca closterium TaxID=2856 RepID=A0AAD2CEQ2_9STRA|nr:unnamed protein product [Cylindrotheca closterium]
MMTAQQSKNGLVGVDDQARSEESSSNNNNNNNDNNNNNIQERDGDADRMREQSSDYFEETNADEYYIDRTRREQSDDLFDEATESSNERDRDVMMMEPSKYFEATEANAYDDRTLLDTFGQVAKDFLTKKVIPDTDAECKWDWRSVRCEPYCECDFNFKGGDYHLGRSCRRRLHVEEHCDPDAPNAPRTATGVRYVILRTVQTSRTLVQRVIQKGKTAYWRLQNRVCSRIPENLACPTSAEDMKHVPLFAWQEKLLCRKQIPDCLMKMPTPPAETISPVRRDESF